MFYMSYSIAAVTPVKYECYSMDMDFFIRLKYPNGEMKF